MKPVLLKCKSATEYLLWAVCSTEIKPTKEGTLTKAHKEKSVF
jgi:hypothetical protein